MALNARTAHPPPPPPPPPPQKKKKKKKKPNKQSYRLLWGAADQRTLAHGTHIHIMI